MRKFKRILIVLGCAPKRDGKPSECMIARLRKAIQLHRKNNYSVVLFSGGPTRYGVPEAAVMRVMALNYLPAEKIIAETRSRSTVQNALFCWEKIKDKNAKSVTVVTSRFCLKRTEYVFRKLYAHMKATLRFEAADDSLDPIERTAYWVKERMMMLYYKIFGF